MDPRDIYFVRLYKMIVDTCRSVMWEMLLQMVQPPDTVINLVEEMILKDSKTTRGLKDLVEFWEKIKTTTPIETDFDITNLCKIILYTLNKQSPRSASTPNVEGAIKEIKNKRDNLSHTGDILMSEEMYQTEYMEIRYHVDLLENTINSNYNRDSKCKWIRQNSSKYLNRIDRIHKEYIDPHASLEIMKLIRQCREELAISEQEEQDVEQNKEKAMDRTKSKVQLVDSDTSTEGEVESDNQSDQYDNEIVEETLQKMDAILGQADENEDDLIEQVQRQHTEIKEMESIVNFQNETAQHDQKEESHHGRFEIGDNSSETLTETKRGTFDESHLTKEQKRHIDGVLDLNRCDRQYKEKIDSYKNSYEHNIRIKVKVENFKTEIMGKSYERMFEDKLKKQRRIIEREIEKLNFRLERDIVAIIEGEDMKKIIHTVEFMTEKLSLTTHYTLQLGLLNNTK